MEELLAKVLSGPWRIASTLLAPELPVIEDPARLKWSRLHSESHPAIEILLALEGGVGYGLEDRLYRLEPGDWMIFLDGDRHDSGYGGYFDGDFCHGWFHLSAQLLSLHIVRRSGGKLNVAGRVVICRDSSFARWAYGELRHLRNSPLSPELKRVHLAGILACLGSRMLEVIAAPSVRDDAATRRVRVIRLVEHEIAVRHGVNVHVEKFARVAGYSVFHFLRLFKSVTGRTFKDYAEDCRESRYRELAGSNLCQKELAAELGFSSASAFCHWRKRKENAAPSPPLAG